jgi:hypothetical protein
MHGSHVIRAGERLQGAISEFEEEMTFFIQI